MVGDKDFLTFVFLVKKWGFWICLLKSTPCKLTEKDLGVWKEFLGWQKDDVSKDLLKEKIRIKRGPSKFNYIISSSNFIILEGISLEELSDLGIIYF